MSVRNPPPYMQNRTDHTAENDRLTVMGLTPGLSTGVFTSQGIVRNTAGTDLQVTQNGTPNMSVNVGPGIGYAQGTEGATQGAYTIINDATMNLAIAASSPTNPRKDAVVGRVRDAIFSGANNDADIVVVTGTPAASPVLPALPSNALLLAEVNVAANATTVVTGNITDRRVLYAPGSIVSTSTTHPSSPVVGQQIFDTNTNTISIWNGSVWVATSGLGVSQIATNNALVSHSTGGAATVCTASLTVPTLPTGTVIECIAACRLVTTPAGVGMTMDITNTDQGLTYSFTGSQANPGTIIKRKTVSIAGAQSFSLTIATTVGGNAVSVTQSVLSVHAV